MTGSCSGLHLKTAGTAFHRARTELTANEAARSSGNSDQDLLFWVLVETTQLDRFEGMGKNSQKGEAFRASPFEGSLPPGICLAAGSPSEVSWVD